LSVTLAGSEVKGDELSLFPILEVAPLNQLRGLGEPRAPAENEFDAL